MDKLFCSPALEIETNEPGGPVSKEIDNYMELFCTDCNLEAALTNTAKETKGGHATNTSFPKNATASNQRGAKMQIASKYARSKSKKDSSKIEQKSKPKQSTAKA